MIWERSEPESGPRSFAREVKIFSRYLNILAKYPNIFKYLGNTIRILDIFFEKFQDWNISLKNDPGKTSIPSVALRGAGSAPRFTCYEYHSWKQTFEIPLTISSIFLKDLTL